ncbi:MAG TPA: serine hydrolase domain-containing protein [Gemmatimonadaceae bacterium]|nr:serine hydrolase domain-containing protein [Gemmatimonadaceae bacterium]
MARILVMAAVTAFPIVAAAQLPAGTTPPTAEVLAAQIDSVMKADILPRGFPSVSIAVTRGGRTLHERAWGVTNVSTGKKAESATTYNIGSMAKQFTAVLILKLVDGGKLSVTDSIGRYLKGLRPEWNAITIEQLLNHTSGLPRDFATGRPETDNVTGDSLIAAAARDTLVSKPGTVFAYSNTGYMLLGVLIEKLHGKPYGLVLRDEIARPLGLTSLGWCESVAKDRAATGYIRSSDGKATLRGDVHASQDIGPSAICSTARDIASWNQALHGGRVVSAASYAAMTTPRGAATGKYGFGLVPRKSSWGSPAINHDGEDNGFSSHNGWYPAESLSVTLLYNALPRLEVNMSDFVGMIALGGKPRPIPPMPVIELPIAATQGEGRPKFVGAYEMGVGRLFLVTFEDGHLHVTPPGGARQQLFLQSGTTYKLGNPQSTTTVTFKVDADGVVTGFTARDNGVDRELRKVK